MAKSKVIVVGAGPAGALAALYAANRGDDVEVYELRPDLRLPSTTPLNFTRSINLAISERGINSIKLTNRPGLVETILNDSIPMHSRMIHGIKNGQLMEESQPYDACGRAIRAVDRGSLNKRLLDELEQMPNVKFFFSHKLTGADFKRNLAWFEQQAMFPDKAGRRLSQNEKRAAEVQRPFDFMIGADGAHSAVRFHLMKYARVSFQQEYIDTLWCEFHIPASATEDGKHGGYKISPNHLHIWPGKTSMFIAIASVEKAFTCTLFLPAGEFAALDQEPDSIVSFFERKFPGVVPSLISPFDLRQQYLENQHLPLVSVKCSPYHYNSSVVILGDAAHAMVPFYGQGMNAGLEDVRVLFDIMDEHFKTEDRDTSVATRRAAALDEYNRYRQPDAFAINDLALRNYKEMRLDVRSPLYLLRKRVEEFLSVNMPGLDVATQYSRVSFGNRRYSEIEAATQRQSSIFHAVVLALGLSMLGFTSWWIKRLYKVRRIRLMLDNLIKIMRNSTR